MPLVGVRVEEDLYRKLTDRAKEEGVSVSDIVRKALLLYLGEPSGSTSKPTVNRAHIQRVVQDLVNPFTQKVDETCKKVALLIERLDALEDRVKGVEEMVKELKTGGEAKTSKEAKKAKRTAMDILREQRIMFESDVARKIRDRDTFFSKLQKEGAVVIEAKDGRVAVEPSFWSQFTEKLKSIRTSNDEELKKHLDKEEYMLFKALRESVLLVFDTTTKTWNILK